MAASGERRMLFDTRGRRKHVIRVVYAVLALLMGASLFLVIGPFNISELVGGGGSSSAAQVLDEQAERIERRLAKDPRDEGLLLALTRTRLAAGGAQLEVSSESASPVVNAAARADYEQGLQAWDRYLKQAGSEPNPTAAQLVAGTYFSLAQAATTPTLQEVLIDVKKAAETQRLVADQRPSVGSLSNLAIYEYFDGDFAAGDRATKQAVGKAPSATEAKGIKEQLAAYRKNGKQWEKQKQKALKEQRELGKQGLQNPFGEASSGSVGQSANSGNGS